MKHTAKRTRICWKSYPNVYRIFQKSLQIWYGKLTGSIVLCLFLTGLCIRLFHKGSVKPALFLGCFTLFVGVATLLYLFGKYQILISSDFTKLERALQTLQKTIDHRFFFTKSAIIILHDFSFFCYDYQKLKRIYFSDEQERGNLYKNAVIHFVMKDGREETLSLRCDCSEFLRTIRTYCPQIQLPRIPLTFRRISDY